MTGEGAEKGKRKDGNAATAARFIPKNTERTGRYTIKNNSNGGYCARIVGTAPARNRVRTRSLSLRRATLKSTSSPG